jgi:hypothetical protein
MNRTTILLLLGLGLAGCSIGRRAEDVELARVPRGATVQLQTRGGPVAGELLEVHDTAIVVLTREQRLTLVPYRAIQRGEVELLQELTHSGRQPDAARREQLRRISRFPHGMTPEVQRALLAVLDQPSLEVLRQ